MLSRISCGNARPSFWLFRGTLSLLTLSGKDFGSDHTFTQSTIFVRRIRRAGLLEPCLVFRVARACAPEQPADPRRASGRRVHEWRRQQRRSGLHGHGFAALGSDFRVRSEKCRAACTDSGCCTQLVEWRPDHGSAIVMPCHAGAARTWRLRRRCDGGRAHVDAIGQRFHRRTGARGVQLAFQLRHAGCF